jgi:hypothetical protein
VALCQARISTKPLWGFSSSNPYHSQSRAEQIYISFLFNAFSFPTHFILTFLFLTVILLFQSVN